MRTAIALLACIFIYAAIALFLIIEFMYIKTLKLARAIGNIRI